VPGEIDARRSGGVHVFSTKDRDLAYDAETGSLHTLDPAGRAVLQWVIDRGPQVLDEGPIPQEVFRQIPRGLSREQIEEAWSELVSLRGKTLFGVADGRETGGYCENHEANPGTQWVKALCLNVAHDCNLACKYCFAGLGRFGGRPQIMTPEVAEKALDFVLKASGPRRFIDVDFFGGEPLMAFPTVKAFVKAARKKGPGHGKDFRFTLTTNCVLLDREALRFLNDEGISLILSLDGRPQVHDGMRVFRDGSPSYAIAMENAQEAVQSRKGQDYYVRGTYTSLNLDFDRDVQHLYYAGFKRISLEPAVGEGHPWDIQECHLSELKASYSRLLEFWHDCRLSKAAFDFYHFDLGLQKGVCKERRVTGCGAGYEYLAVTPSGRIYPCHQMVGNEAMILGDVGAGVQRIDLQSSFKAARVPHKEECSKCWAKHLCGGGCHARALASTGNVMTPDPLSCLIMKMRLEYGLCAEAEKALQEEISTDG
jgi:uncharacterized protein